MSKFLSAFFLMAGLAFALPQAQAQSEPVTPKKTVKKKAVKKKVAGKKFVAAKMTDSAAEKIDEKVDTTGHSSTHYSCEMDHKVTIHKQPKDDQQITVTWRNRQHTLLRVNTTTGADRFEGPKSGLVWVGIPSKGMLLDAHKGQPLANECKSAAQLKQSN